MNHKGRFTLTTILLAVLLAIGLLVAIASIGAAANPAVNIDQGANGKATAREDPVDWQNGNLNENNSHFAKGYSVPYRVILTNLPTGIGNSITLTIGFDIKNSDKHALDFITHYQRLDPHTIFGHDLETVNPKDGVTVSTSTETTFPIPVPSSAGSSVPGQPTAEFNSLPAGEKVMTLFGGTITDIQYGVEGSLTAAQSETTVKITFWADSPTAVLAWGGHIAESAVWGAGQAATGISGSPYHMRTKEWLLPGDTIPTSLGNEDRSLKSFTVGEGTLRIVKNTVGGNDTFGYTVTGGPTSVTDKNVTTRVVGHQALARYR